ncbi:unnamed protein product [Bursaphelenchus okinawaensis]|uniref:Protein kinase domain-containing protein n=1 Tax=Bursaphelenchus okinawaensis TaxID=465554 RepID=A0A811KLD7_9BILA|nr:unnamed protein product [Bursaphelenchus okinawaensis]CAG9106993.1 unnamed protein product [Bursaphelenchus okinawaensis]
MEVDSITQPTDTNAQTVSETMEEVDSVDAFVATPSPSKNAAIPPNNDALPNQNDSGVLRTMDNIQKPPLMKSPNVSLMSAKSVDVSMESNSLSRMAEMELIVNKSPMSERIRPGAPVELVKNAKRRKLSEPRHKNSIPKFQRCPQDSSIHSWLRGVKEASESNQSASNLDLAVPQQHPSDSDPSNGSNNDVQSVACSSNAANTSTSTLKPSTTPRAEQNNGTKENIRARENSNPLHLNPPFADKHYKDLLAENQTLRQENLLLLDKIQADEQNKAKYKEMIRHLLIEKGIRDRNQARLDVQANINRLGSFQLTRVNDKFEERWKNGTATDENRAKFSTNAEQRERLNSLLEQLKKKKRVKKANDSDSRNSSSNQMDDGFLRPEEPNTPQDIYEREEIIKLQRDQLKKEELELMAEREKIERDKNLHVKEHKRIQYEDVSLYRNFVVFSQRYLLLTLLGKGGFSEVWQAYDMNTNQYVACKIHHVNKDWKEEKKANYVKHAMREKDIHMTLDHPRIVKLYNVFHIDDHSFCTVLEYCGGNDLDIYLKQNKMIPEKEARCIIMQVVSALKYLSEHDPQVIHYDLKPANILLQNGNGSGTVKITDFGLSKTLEDSEDGHSIELTSQGAGTYWYLPPETFQHFSHGAAPRISNKVDVWSVGVIFFQCLYARRPFGHEHSQQQILQERIILNARNVEFPAYPKVSQGAQDFIRACLEYNKDQRVDVTGLANHPYLKPRSYTPRNSNV